MTLAEEKVTLFSVDDKHRRIPVKNIKNWNVALQPQCHRHTDTAVLQTQCHRHTDTAVLQTQYHRHTQTHLTRTQYNAPRDTLQLFTKPFFTIKTLQGFTAGAQDVTQYTATDRPLQNFMTSATDNDGGWAAPRRHVTALEPAAGARLIWRSVVQCSKYKINCIYCRHNSTAFPAAPIFMKLALLEDFCKELFHQISWKSQKISVANDGRTDMLSPYSCCFIP